MLHALPVALSCMILCTICIKCIFLSVVFNMVHSYPGCFYALHDNSWGHYVFPLSFKVYLSHLKKSLCNQLLPEFSSNHFETLHICYQPTEDVQVMCFLCYMYGPDRQRIFLTCLSIYFFFSPPVFFCQFYMDVAVAFPLKKQFHRHFLM